MDKKNLHYFWHPIATSEEVKSTGRPLVRKLLSRPLVFFRDANGNAVCLADKCPHRSAPLSLGTITNGNLKCAYHGWEFSSDGAAVQIPSIPPDAPTPKKCAESYEVHEADGTIWVRFDSTDPGRSNKPEWPKPSGDDYRFFELLNEVKAPVDLMLENFVDCAHTPFVHGGLFRTPGEQIVEAEIQVTPTGVLVNTTGEKSQKSLLGVLFNGTNNETVHTDEYIIPTTVKVDYSWGTARHIRSVSICTPLNDETSLIFTRVYVRMPFLSKLITYFLKGVTQKILSQDRRVLEGQAKVIQESGKADFSAVGSDAPIAWVRRSYFGLLDGQSKISNDEGKEARKVKIKYRI